MHSRPRPEPQYGLGCNLALWVAVTVTACGTSNPGAGSSAPDGGDASFAADADAGSPPAQADATLTADADAGFPPVQADASATDGDASLPASDGSEPPDAGPDSAANDSAANDSAANDSAANDSAANDSAANDSAANDAAPLSASPPLGERVLGQELFDSNWRFNRGDVTGGEQPALDDSLWRSLDLPHDFSIELPYDETSLAGSGGAYLDGGIAWYRKTFSLPATFNAQTGEVRVRFDGVYMNSDAYINGHSLGNHPYGYTSFEYDLTPYLNASGTPNILAVRVNNQQPSSRWYSGSGIYRHVWLISSGQVHTKTWSTFITTPTVTTSSATVNVATSILNDGASDQTVTVTTTIVDDTGVQVATQSSTQAVTASGSTAFSLTHTLSTPKLWSVSTPTLYQVQLDVAVGGTVVDSYTSPFGIRTFAFDANAGFSLNGQSMKLHGVADHHDLGSLGAAINERAIQRQLQILKAMGGNAIRTAHNPPAPELLALADQVGVLIMDEAFDCWETGKVANDYHLYFDEWGQRDIQSMVDRDRNHPSVILWSIGNEIPDATGPNGLTLAQKLIGWVRSEDSTRPITQALLDMNEPGPQAIAAVLDVVGYNYNPYLYDAQHAQNPQWKMFGSEVSSAIRSRGVYETGNLQCSSYDDDVVSWGNSAESSWTTDRDRAYLAGEFIWSGFDYLGEPTPYPWPAKNSYFGIVDTSGFPKDIYYMYQSQWTQTPMVHLLPHWTWDAGETIQVFAYSNADSVELFLNGSSLGSQSMPTTGTTVHVAWSVPFEPGTLQAIATKGGVQVATDQVQTAGDAAAIALSADRSVIAADTSDLAFIEADVVDANGVLVPTAANEIQFSVQGPAKIIAVDNGDSTNQEPYQAQQRAAFSGKVLAIVKPTGSGSFVVSAISVASDGGAGLASNAVTVVAQ
jgi:beta-galactosidase